jgi:gluconokinase
MNYYIGIDIGTTSTKAVAFSIDGNTVAKETIGYAILHPRPNYSEQNPDEILEAVINCIGAVTRALPQQQAVFISFSAAMHSMMAVDETGKPLTHCIIWADNRAAEIADELRAIEQGARFYHETGVPIHAMSPLCKLLWFRENEPTIFRNAAKFIGIKEYIFHRLFGKYVVDTPVASATGLLNIYTLQWDAAILRYASVSVRQLSAVVDPTHTETLTTESAYFADSRLQSVLTTVFVTGGSDGGLANLGSGAVTKNSMAVSIGTSGAVRMVSAEVHTDRYMRTFCYHMQHNQYIIGGASNNGAVVLQWLKDDLLQTGETHEQLLELAAAVVPGSNGLLFIPYLLGERAPVWNEHAKGVFFGLDITHNKAHMVRAVMEGVVYSVYSIGRLIMEERRVTEIHATGGFTQNDCWLQMLSDMFNCTVLVSGAVETSAFGAVKLAREATGNDHQWIPKTTACYEPDAQRHQVYLRQFEKMERIYELLKNEMGNTETHVYAANLGIV